eukprot:Partr_v1_DN28537_c0_g1_i2_m73708 putative Carbohydrate esterase family 9 protein
MEESTGDNNTKDPLLHPSTSSSRAHLVDKRIYNNSFQSNISGDGYSRLQDQDARDELTLAKRKRRPPSWKSKNVSRLSSTGGTRMWPRLRVCGLAILMVVAIVQLVVVSSVYRFLSDSAEASGKGAVVGPLPFTPEDRELMLLKCGRTLVAPVDSQEPVFDNPGAHSPRPLLIRNATVWTGVAADAPMPAADVHLEAGVIIDIGTGIRCASCVVVEARGRVLTPGLVDMHSHAGLDPMPFYHGADDVNDGLIIASQLRVRDALNPRDSGLSLIAAGGVTTSLILPGSANIMGGEAMVVKLGRPAPTVARMSFYFNQSAPMDVQEDDPLHWRWMKMAMGENPKRYHGSSDAGHFPSTRMGSAWLMRSRLSEAAALKHSQDSWCRRFTNTSSDAVMSHPFPERVELESLVALLRHQVKLNVHVYTAHDIETLLRISREFEFSIAAIHHATSAHIVSSMLANERSRPGSLNANLTVALFSDKGFYKNEAYDASYGGPSVLLGHDVPIAFKSDHPVTNAQTLAWQAAKSVNYGLSPRDALAAVTSVPARALGLGHRIGTVKIGMDADLVLWDGGNPMLDVGAHPSHVIVDGEIVTSYDPKSVDDDYMSFGSMPATDNFEHDLCGKLDQQPEDLNILFTNLTNIHADKDVHYENGSEIYIKIRKVSHRASKSYHVSNSSILCMGAKDSCAQFKYAKRTIIIDTMGGIVLPQLVAAPTALGLSEIEMETGTKMPPMQGSIDDKLAFNGGLGVVESFQLGLDSDDLIVDGSFSKMLEIASRSGVGVSISVPPLPKEGIVRGLSTVIYTAAELSEQGVVVLENAALHISIEHSDVYSISSQIDFLKQFLFQAVQQSKNATASEDLYEKHKFYRTRVEADAFRSVVENQLPLAVHVHNAEQISAILALKKEVETEMNSQFRVVIIGGAEAWRVASQIALSPLTSLILTPVRCTPGNQDSRRCRSMTSLQHPILTRNKWSREVKMGMAILFSAGVRIAVGPADDNMVTSLLWDAGYARWMSDKLVNGDLSLHSTNKLTVHDAVGMVTWNIAEIFGLDTIHGTGRIAEFSLPNLAVYIGDHPLTTVTNRLLFSISTSNSARNESLVRCLQTQL